MALCSICNDNLRIRKSPGRRQAILFLLIARGTFAQTSLNLSRDLVTLKIAAQIPVWDPATSFNTVCNPAGGSEPLYAFVFRNVAVQIR